MAKEYIKGDLTVIWNPKLCSHSAKCVKGLPQVFRPNEKPWIQTENADQASLIAQIKTCPSGALSYKLAGERTIEMAAASSETQVEAIPGGPLIIHGNVSCKNEDGSIVLKENRSSYCRCGASSNQPFCDGSHRNKT